MNKDNTLEKLITDFLKSNEIELNLPLVGWKQVEDILRSLGYTIDDGDQNKYTLFYYFSDRDGKNKLELSFDTYLGTLTLLKTDEA